MDFLEQLNTLPSDMLLHSVNSTVSRNFTSIMYRSDIGLRFRAGDGNYTISDEQDRLIELVRNTDGVVGYRLEPGDGYVLTIYNAMTGQQQLTPKPLRLLYETESYAFLRGFSVDAMTPIGFTEIDMSDYGLSIFLESGEVVGCIVHRFDTNINYGYSTHSTFDRLKQEHEKQSNYYGNTDVENYAKKGLTFYLKDPKGESAYNALRKSWDSCISNPEQLRFVTDHLSVGLGLLIFLSYGTIRAIVKEQQIATLSYLFISMAIEQDPQNPVLYGYRVCLLTSYHDALKRTVALLEEANFSSHLFMHLSPLRQRDILYKMQYSDFSTYPEISEQNQDYYDLFYELDLKVSEGFFGHGLTPQDVDIAGKKHHKDLLDLLTSRVIDSADIDFEY